MRYGKRVDPTDKLRIIPAYVTAARLVLSYLSKDEAEERDRLGIKDNEGILKEVREGRAFMVIDHIEPWHRLAIFGVTAEGCIWFLPTQYFVDNYPRQFADKRVMQWVIDWCYEFAVVKKLPTTMWNGVTPQASSRLRKWLTRILKVRFVGEPIPTVINGWPAQPFVVPKENGRV